MTENRERVVWATFYRGVTAHCFRASADRLAMRSLCGSVTSLPVGLTPAPGGADRHICKRCARVAARVTARSAGQES